MSEAPVSPVPAPVLHPTAAALREDLRKARVRIAELDALVRELSALEEPPPETKAALKALHHALRVVGFAVGNAPPTATAGWPFEDLRSLAHSIEDMGQVDPDYRQITKDWLVTAAEAEDCERIRADRRAKTVGAAPPSAEERLEGAAQLLAAMPDIARRKLPREVLEQLGATGVPIATLVGSNHERPPWWQRARAWVLVAAVTGTGIVITAGLSYLLLR